MLTIPVSLTLGGADQSISQLVRERDAGTFSLDVTVNTDLTNKTLTAYIRRPDNQVIEDLDNFNVTDFLGGQFTYTPPDNAFWYKGNVEIDFLITELDNDTITTPKVLFEIVKPVDKNRTIQGEDTPVYNQDLMRKNVYDTNDNGVVDNSESLGGSPATDYMLIAVYEPEIDDNTNYRLLGHIPVSEKAQPNGVATLNVDGKIETAQLPALVIIDTYPVNSEIEQLALEVQQGDVAVRLDESKSYINVTGNNTAMSDWQELLSPTDAVQSVNGKIGTVVLTTADITESGNLYYTESRVTNNTTVQSLVTPTRATEQTTNESAFGYPVGTVRGLYKALYEGRSIFNLADNGVDYANWIVTGSSTKSALGIHIDKDTDREVELSLPLSNTNPITLIVKVNAINTDLRLGIFTKPVLGFGTGPFPTVTEGSLGIFEILYTPNETPNTLVVFLESGDKVGATADFELLATIEGDAISENITQELSYGYNFVSAEITETSTDGINTDTRTLDYTPDYTNGLSEINGIVDDSNTKRNSDYTAIISGQAINTANFPTALTSGGYIIQLDAGGNQEGLVDNGETASGNGQIRFNLATPIAVTTPQKPLATFENGSYSATVPSGLHPVKKYTTPTNKAATIEDTHQYQVELGAWVESKLS